MKIAVIDFSSTSLSLLVENVSGEMMIPVVGIRKSVSILGYLSKKGKISERGIEKVVDSIKFLVEAAEKVGAESVHIISTASMRIIKNYEEVAAAVKSGTGLSITNLDGISEAYADYIANREYTTLGNSILLDIGGYSSSIVDMSDSDKSDMFALDIGPAALFQAFDLLFISPEIQGIGKVHLFIPLFKCAFVRDHLDPAVRVHSEISAAFRADIIAVLHIFGNDRRAALIALAEKPRRDFRV